MVQFYEEHILQEGDLILYSKPSSIWKGVKEGLFLLNPNVVYILGSESKCSFWEDIWLNGRKVSKLFQITLEVEYARNYSIAQMRENTV